MSLYRKEELGQLHCEVAKNLFEITQNAIMEEFDAIYDREQELI